VGSDEVVDSLQELLDAGERTRRMALSAIMPKKPSTWLSQELLGGMKCVVQRERAASQILTFEWLCVASCPRCSGCRGRPVQLARHIVGVLVVSDATIQTLINIEAKARSAIRPPCYCSNRFFVQ
jgi:hypothetical protein